jgi:hypothetical protein
MSAKTPFSIRFQTELLEEVRAVSIQVGIPMTKIIEVAVQQYMPVIKDHLRQTGGVND